jgi:hypothetical protein
MTSYIVEWRMRAEGTRPFSYQTDKLDSSRDFSNIEREQEWTQRHAAAALRNGRQVGKPLATAEPLAHLVRSSSSSRRALSWTLVAAAPLHHRHRRVACASSSAAIAAREGLAPPGPPFRCLRQLFLHRRRRRESAPAERQKYCLWSVCIGRRPRSECCAHAAGTTPCRVARGSLRRPVCRVAVDLPRQPSLALRPRRAFAFVCVCYQQ